MRYEMISQLLTFDIFMVARSQIDWGNVNNNRSGAQVHLGSRVTGEITKPCGWEGAVMKKAIQAVGQEQ